jgi:hypothetical protein
MFALERINLMNRDDHFSAEAICQRDNDEERNASST